MNEPNVVPTAGLNTNFLAVVGSEEAASIATGVTVVKTCGLADLLSINLITLVVASAFVPL